MSRRSHRQVLVTMLSNQSFRNICETAIPRQFSRVGRVAYSACKCWQLPTPLLPTSQPAT